MEMIEACLIELEVRKLRGKQLTFAIYDEMYRKITLFELKFVLLHHSF